MISAYSVRMIRLVASIVTGVLVLAGCAGLLGGPGSGSATVGKAEREIRRELDSLPDHDWAGEYCYWPSEAATVLLVAPKSGAVFQSLYDIGPSVSEAAGSVTESEGLLRVSWTYHTDEWTPPEEYLVIPWGERRYMVPVAEILEFCCAVQSGAEPRLHPQGYFFMRRSDTAAVASGDPILPAGYEKYLHMEPIEARIKAIGEVMVDDDDGGSDCEWVSQAVTLDVGEDAGVLLGMRFRNRGGGIVAVVHIVSPGESEATISWWRPVSGKGNAASVGMVLSSCY